jgi:hypothetical protein
MHKEPPGVTFRLIRGNSLSICAGKLVFEGDQPFADLINPSSGESFSPPQRIRLPQGKLELLADEQAGRPAWYLCREILVAS